MIFIIVEKILVLLTEEPVVLTFYKTDEFMCI